MKESTLTKLKNVFKKTKMRKNLLDRVDIERRLAQTPSDLPQIDLPKRWASCKKYTPEVLDKSSTSCTADAIYYLWQTKNKAQNGRWTPSRSYIAYYLRVSTDIFAHLMSAGCCGEQHHSGKGRPSDIALIDAKNHTIKNVTYVDRDLVGALKSLLSAGNPSILLMNIYNDFTQFAGKGVLDESGKAKYLGGYDVCVVGYSDDTELFTAIASNGKGWGHEGYIYIPYGYVARNGLQVVSFDV